MNGNDGSAASRQFVAASPSVSSTMNEFATGNRTLVLLYAMGIGVGLGVGAGVGASVGVGMGLGVGLGSGTAIIMLVPLVWLVYAWWRSRRSVLIGVTSDGLTVSQRPGDVFSLVEAELGPWVTMGVALHLRCGRHRFVLGARDRRISPATRLDAPPVAAVDAWLSDSEFNELLAIGGGRGAVNLREPALGERTRCPLFPNPYLAEQAGSFALRKQLRLQRSLRHPSLFLDVDVNAIRVVDPHSDATSASASPTRATATPAAFQPDSVTSGDGSTHVYPGVTGLVVCVPGVRPLTIGCLEASGSGLRFSWRGNVSTRNERPVYVVSGADWLTLAQIFGLAPRVEDAAATGRTSR
ncbi:hypothetical protein A5787_25090 [Mycobacterium sp. 852002-50816_SCH5313054-b]|uniref:hypothetical protein n=1 Tax=Mycobacterium sp. 852002-50816_SCH5313054-b TaxID=1834092 RepID=UPI0007FF2E74|nr:hypothetical protein [Mycobacterium sp. 852002-50816_SCH5313054-b]OBF57460.1 hypothetical protein A5787_25090 [Mycobacterium sp. 852002-50816_SCH5313054-b]